MWYLVVSIPDLCTLTYFGVVLCVMSLFCNVAISVFSSFAIILLAKNDRADLEVINLEIILRLKMKRNDWVLADMCRQNKAQ